MVASTVSATDSAMADQLIAAEASVNTGTTESTTPSDYVDLFGYIYPTSFLIYSGVFWGGLTTFLSVLFGYNLLKMFGLDEEL